MARIKISTVMEDRLFRRAKLEALRQNTTLADVIGEALETYLAGGATRSPGIGVVDESWGVLTIDRSRLEELLQDEPGLLDS